MRVDTLSLSHLLSLFCICWCAPNTPSPLRPSSSSPSGLHCRMKVVSIHGGGLITSCVLCIAPPAPPPSGPSSTLTPGGSSTLSKKRPPPPPPGHKRTLSDPPSPLSHSPHSKGGLTGGETQSTRVTSRAGFPAGSPENRDSIQMKLFFSYSDVCTLLF